MFVARLGARPRLLAADARDIPGRAPGLEGQLQDLAYAFAILGLNGTSQGGTLCSLVSCCRVERQEVDGINVGLGIGPGAARGLLEARCHARKWAPRPLLPGRVEAIQATEEEVESSAASVARAGVPKEKAPSCHISA